MLGFQTQVQKSSESAKLALETVPVIEDQIREVYDVVEQAEQVLLISYIIQNSIKI